MLLILFLVAASVVALAADPREDHEVIDLQMLLLNVSRSYQDFGKGMSEFTSEIVSGVNRINDNINRVNSNINSVNENIMELAWTLRDNANRSENNQLESTVVLRQILGAMKQTGFHRNNTESRNATDETSEETGDETAEDCSELHDLGVRKSGEYRVTLPRLRRTARVYCDMTTDGGGWTVFQRRGEFGFPEENFFRNWSQYKTGFGDFSQEFWFGNDNLALFTKHKLSVLRVDLWDEASNHAYAKYGSFRVGDEDSFYQLTIGGYTGTAGDSMTQHTGQNFSTPDWEPLAVQWGGPWWNYATWYSNLNGMNLRGKTSDQSIRWHTWKGAANLAFTEMKFRSASF